MQIKYLADHLSSLSKLARWHFAEWGYLQPNETLEERIERLKKSCGFKQVPTVVIGLLGDTLCGSAMLVAQDMDSKPEFTPWLAGVYVAPEYRSKGYGAALIERIIKEAATLNMSKIYLYTPDAEDYYLKLGWLIVERCRYRDVNVSIMSFQIAD